MIQAGKEIQLKYSIDWICSNESCGLESYGGVVMATRAELSPHFSSRLSDNNDSRFGLILHGADTQKCLLLSRRSHFSRARVPDGELFATELLATVMCLCVCVFLLWPCKD